MDFEINIDPTEGVEVKPAQAPVPAQTAKVAPDFSLHVPTPEYVKPKPRPKRRSYVEEADEYEDRELGENYR
jgi:hypothetical protein